MADIAIFRINYKSDFILTLQSDAGWLTPFCIKFWTGAPSNGYFAGFDGENYVNCRVGDEPTKLLVMFDDHHMLVGPLRMQIVYHTTIEEFPGRQFDEVTNVTNVTVDIDGTEYQVMLDFTGESGAEIDFSMPSSGVMSVNGKNGYVTLNAEDVGAQPTIEDLEAIRSGAAAGATAVQPAALQQGLATKQDTITDLSTIRSGAAAGATAVQPVTLQEGLATKQDVISDLSTIRNGAAAGATAVQPAGLTPIESALQTIESVIPSAASSQNQLADKNFVNSSISTNTANFVGTYNSLAELQAVQNPTNNDYGFVIETDAQGNEYYDRYKYVASSQQWLFEYKVESTPFTAAQWAAIQSGITSALVTKLNALPTNAELQQTLDGKADAADIPTALSQLSQDYTHRVVTDAEKSTWNGKQNAISDLATIRSGAAAGATAVQPATLQEGLATKQNVIEDLSTIRSGAAAGATAVQPNEMTAALAGKQNVIEDLATIRSGAAAGANAVQPAAMNTALAAKQDTLTFDNTPTDNSDNPVKSGGIKTALDAKQTTISTVNVTVDNNTGTPSGSASVSGSTLSLSFQNLKGATGATGATGPQGPQGERGLPGESGVTGDVSGFTVIQTIDPSATYGPTDIAGAATVQATNAELTELEGQLIVREDMTIPSGTVVSGYWINDSLNWATRNGGKFCLISVQEGDKFYVISNGSEPVYMYWLSSYNYPTNPAAVIGTKIAASSNQTPITVTAPSGATYLYVLYYLTASRNATPSVFQKLSSFVDTVVTDGDIVNDLTTGGSNKVLSAEQGKTLGQELESVSGLVLENVTIPSSIRKANYWINGSQNWEYKSGMLFTLVPAAEGDVFYITGGDKITYMYWLTAYSGFNNTTALSGVAPVVSGTSQFAVNTNGKTTSTAPTGTKYLYMLYQAPSGNCSLPSKVQVIRGGNEVVEDNEVYYDGQKVSVGNRLRIKLLQNLTSTMSGSSSAEVEGFAVTNGYAAVTRLTGYISLYRLKDDKFFYVAEKNVSEFNNNNAANFGVEYHTNGDEIPLLYVSWQGGITCYVYRIQVDGTCTHVQTITVENLPSVYCGEWAIDKERGKIILYTASEGNPASGDAATTHMAKHRVVVWPIPSLRDGNENIVSSITLDYNNAEEAYIMEDVDNDMGYIEGRGYVDENGMYTWVYQGICAKNGRLIIPCGGYSAKRMRGLRVWDMDSRKQVNHIDLTDPIYKNHPYWEIEDCDVVDGSVYLFCRDLDDWAYSHVYRIDFD